MISVKDLPNDRVIRGTFTESAGEQKKRVRLCLFEHLLLEEDELNVAESVEEKFPHRRRVIDREQLGGKHETETTTLAKEEGRLDSECRPRGGKTGEWHARGERSLPRSSSCVSGPVLVADIGRIANDRIEATDRIDKEKVRDLNPRLAPCRFNSSSSNSRRVRMDLDAFDDRAVCAERGQASDRVDKKRCVTGGRL